MTDEWMWIISEKSCHILLGVPIMFHFKRKAITGLSMHAASLKPSMSTHAPSLIQQEFDGCINLKAINIIQPVNTVKVF